MPTTAEQGFPYPALSEPANGPVAFQQLAESLEGKTVYTRTSGNMPPHLEGRLVYQTDTDRLVVSDGATWLEVWKKGGGRVAQIVTAGLGTTAAETVLATVTINADGTTPYEIAFSWYNFVKTVASDVFLASLWEGPTAGSGTQLATALLLIGVANGGSGIVRAQVTPSAGAHTYTARQQRSSGTGTASFTATPTSPAILSATPLR